MEEEDGKGCDKMIENNECLYTSHPSSNGGDVVANIIAALENFYRSRLGRTGFIALHEPLFKGNEWTYVKECIDTGWVSSAGKFVDRFEAELAHFCGVAKAVATINGTAGLHIALQALGVKANELVICPPLTFVASANAIAHCGAEPLFLDVDDDLGLSANALQDFLKLECERISGGLRHLASGRRVAAVLAVHVFGNPAEVDKIAETCVNYNIPLVEDTAEALGSTFKERICGTFGKAGVLSFNGNKTITTGAGGAVITDDLALAQRIKHLTTTARVAHQWEFEHDEVGYNYRMANINAALGCAQLEVIQEYISQKRLLANMIYETLRKLPGVTVLQERPGASSNFWLNGFLVDPVLRQEILSKTNLQGIQTRPCWRLLADLPMFAKCKTGRGGVMVAREKALGIINVPSGPALLAGA